MAITQAFCNNFKHMLLLGEHNFKSAQDTIRLALYDSTATLGATTTAYTATNEEGGTGYTAKGNDLGDPTSSGSGTQSVAYLDFADTTWSTSTITCRGALMFNDDTSTPGDNVTDAAMIVLDFGSDKSSSAGDFTVQFPAAATGTAIIRIS